MREEIEKEGMTHDSVAAMNSPDNLRAFVVARPPLVLFLIFLTSVAATLLCLTAYLANNDIRDPSVDYDWNLFLENFAKIDFCVESQR